ncbi:MAG: hypothetical protein GY757_22830, partial [bacterium]|nr:hypothetical protein [bacterium]
METKYWIIKLRLPLLLKLISRQKRENITAVTYLDTTAPARTALKLLKPKTFTTQYIEPRYTPSGPRLNLATVRNDKGEVIIIDIYHQVLRTRSQIWEKMRNSFKDFAFLKNKNAYNMLSACISVKIAEEITPTFYIANYARWKAYENKETEIKNILVIPNNRWSDILTENLTEEVHQIIIGKKDKKQELKHQVFVLKQIVRGIMKLGIKAFSGQSKKDATKTNPQHSGPRNLKIMATYAMGIFKDRRNDISYYHASGMKPEQMFFYFKYNPLLPTEEEVEWLKENNVATAAGPGMYKTIPGVTKWKPTPNLKTILKEYYRNYIQTVLRAYREKKKMSLWLMAAYAEIGLETAYWKDFFKANGIGIIVHQVPASENFIPNLAIAENGGLSAYMERSILFGYCTYIHNSPNHVGFLTGPYSLENIPEPSYTTCTIQTGALNVGSTFGEIEGIETLKRNNPIIIAVFDEMPNEWFFGESVAQMYQGLIELVDMDPRFGLLIKTKKPQVFETLEQIDKEIKRLKSNGRCIIADWKVTAPAAATNSELVVCVPSTAAFESLLTGTRTILFNPMRSGSGIFYSNNGLNRRIFEDAENMKQALIRYADGKD